jgi:ferrochelatase
MSQSAILLLAHGTPNRLSEMSDYLQHVTNGRPIPPHVIVELQHRYAEIGLGEEPLPNGPPLTRWTLRQAQLLEKPTGRKVYVGMRNWHPFIADTVAQMKADGVTHARVLCLAPQNSRTSTGLYKRALDAAVADAFTYDFTSGWADDPLLALAFAERLWPVWAEACAATSAAAGNPVRVPVLFTAHSVPCHTILSTTPPSGVAAGFSPRLESREPGASARAIPADGIQDYGVQTNRRRRRKITRARGND